MKLRRRTWLAICVLLLLAIAVLSFSGCSDERTLAPAPPQTELEKAVAEKVEAERRATSAIKTSEDAKKEIAKKTEEISAAKSLIASSEQDIKDLAALAATLRTQEIAARVSSVSAWVSSIGGTILLLGGVLFYFAPGKLSIGVLLGGAVLGAAGLVGLWLAPDWLIVIECIAAAFGLAVVGAIIVVLREYHFSLHSLYHKTQEEAMQEPRLAKMLRRIKVVK